MKIPNKVFFLEYVIEKPDDTIDDVTFLGVYSTEMNARRALDRYRRESRFTDSSGNFVIGPCLVDFEYWDGGFGPVDPTLE